MRKTRSFFLGAALTAVAAYLGACAGQPNAGCPVLSDSLNTAGAYWGQYTLVSSNDGGCDTTPGELFGFQKYHPPGAATTTLAYGVEGLTNEVVNNGRVDSTDGGAARINGFAKIAEFPSKDSYCEVTDFTPAQQDFDAVPSVALDDGGMTPPLPALFKRYDWSTLRTLATINAPGTLFTGTLNYTQDTCHATYKVLGIFPAAECDPTKNEPSRGNYNLDCDPRAVTAADYPGLSDAGVLPDGGRPDLSHSMGSGINPTFATTAKPLTCQAEPSGNSSLGGYCYPQLTADEISKL